jgi:ubiquinone/menaquinone biosynthesis C-methylase UbiE
MEGKTLKIFLEIHNGLVREGPGDNASTEKAYRMLSYLPPKPRILDVGCGPGMQTIELAKLSNGTIDALDNHQPFLDYLAKRAEETGFSQKINPINGNMFSLNYQDKTFDLIWCEGAIYLIGFEKGIKQWRKLLTDKGYLVASELSWLEFNPPQEIKHYWEKNYPAIKTTMENLEIAKKGGYRIVNHFILPEKSWWENYYTPIVAKIPKLKKKYAKDKEALKVLENEEIEIEMYTRYSAHYGYVFYIMQVLN